MSNVVRLPIVTEAAMRPASDKRRCFYCQKPVGEVHKDDCVLIQRYATIRVTLEYEAPYPASWGKDNVAFQLDESSWCADNLVGDLRRHVARLEAKGFCLCDSANFTVLELAQGTFLSEDGVKEETE